MEEMLKIVFASESPLSWQAVILSELLTFVMLLVVAEVYVRTHQGLSYSKSFVQSLVLGGLVGCALMMAVGNNLARGIGILGTLAIVRFRSTIKDPKDMIFVFQSLALGIAMGVQAYAVGLISAVMFCAGTVLLGYTSYGTKQQFDGLLRFLAPTDPQVELRLRDLLGRYCKHWVLVFLREVEQGTAVEHSYHIKLMDSSQRLAFLQDLEALQGVRGLSFYLDEGTEDL